MSRTATAIRLVQHGSFPAMLVFYEQGHKKGFIPSGKERPSSLSSASARDPHSLAATLIANKLEDDKSGDVRGPLV